MNSTLYHNSWSIIQRIFPISHVDYILFLFLLCNCNYLMHSLHSICYFLATSSMIFVHNSIVSLIPMGQAQRCPLLIWAATGQRGHLYGPLLTAIKYQEAVFITVDPHDLLTLVLNVFWCYLIHCNGNVMLKVLSHWLHWQLSQLWWTKSHKLIVLNIHQLWISCFIGLWSLI